MVFIKDNKWVEALLYIYLTTHMTRPTFTVKYYTVLKLYKCNFLVFPISYCHHNTQNLTGYEIYSTVLPVCTIAMAFEAMCKCCSRVFLYNSNSCF
jgi:ABC-type dipeptide/oligopeptide/nickel transport system permease component